MVARWTALGVMLAMFAVLANVAQAKPVKRYVLRHPAHQRCRAHYARRVITVRKRVHGRRVRMRQVVCVYKPQVVHSSPSLPLGAPDSATYGPSTLLLHDKIDPSFKQSPTNPLAVTYSFSASATESVFGAERPASLPAGILNLYSDGLLACSINVGGAVAGGECPITYAALGAHTVILTYTAGSQDATETVVEQIKPFATRTTLKLSEPMDCTTGTEKEEGSCTYGAEVATSDQNGNVPGEGGVSLTFLVQPEEEFTPYVDPEKLGEHRMFSGPVTFTLERTHNEEGWQCVLKAGGMTEYFSALPETRSMRECGTSVSVYAQYDDFPGYLWTSSETEQLPVHF